MSWTVNCICHFLQTICSFILPRSLKSGVTCCLDKCLDIHIPRSDPIKRLQRKNLRKYGRCKRRKKHGARRIVNKLKKLTNEQTVRVLGSDFLANAAYNHRISKTVETPNVKPGDYPEGCDSSKKINSSSTQKKEQYQDYRDVRKSTQPEGLKWWTKLQQNATTMPPLKQGTIDLTTSNSSAMSLEPELKISDSSVGWNSPTKGNTSKAKNAKRSLNRQAAKAVHYAQPCGGTKSESKIDSARRGKFNLDVIKSASTKTIKFRSLRAERKKLSSKKRQVKKPVHHNTS